MAALVARFWLRRTADGRYQTHELLRHFAREQLAQSPTQPAAESRYIHYHLNHIAQQQAQAGHLLGKEMLAEWTHFWADVEQAWAGALRRQMWGELEGAIAAVGAFYLHKGLLADGIHFLAQAAEEVQAHLHQKAADPAAQRVWVLLLIEQAHLRNIQVQSQPVPALMAQAVAWATALGDLPLQWAAQVKWVRALNRLGQSDEALQKGEALLAEMGTAVAPQLKAELWNCLGVIYIDQGALGQGERYLRQSMEQYEALEITSEAAMVRHNLALNLAHMGQLTQARRLFQTNLAWWRAYPSPSRMGTTREGLGYVYLQWGRLGAAASHLQVAVQIYDQLEDWDGVAYASLYLGQVAGRQGAWAAAERYYHTAVRLRHKLNHPRLLPPCWAGLAEAVWRQGHTAEANRHLAKAVPALLAEEIEGEDMAQAYAVVARLLREMGDEAGAEGVRQVGWRRLQEQAAALGENAAVREAFFTAVPSHRWLAEAAGFEF
jgi:tetratricopeptide (TPR) repeat protein